MICKECGNEMHIVGTETVTAGGKDGEPLRVLLRQTLRCRDPRCGGRQEQVDHLLYCQPKDEKTD